MVNAYPNFLKCKHITFSLNLANVGLQNFIKSILKFPWNTCVFIKSIGFLVASTNCHCIFFRLWGSPSIPACPGFALFPCLSHESPTMCWIPTHCLTPSAVNKHYGYLWWWPLSGISSVAGSRVVLPGECYHNVLWSFFVVGPQWFCCFTGFAIVNTVCWKNCSFSLYLDLHSSLWWLGAGPGPDLSRKKPTLLESSAFWGLPFAMIFTPCSHFMRSQATLDPLFLPHWL